MADGNTRYLYGASIQGIQGFIFQTNKLKEIVGGSELVEKICTTAFHDFAKNGESIVRAAGNIKHVFTTEQDCKDAILGFPRKVMTMAPGITISQAVVTLKEDETDYATQSDKLEKLLRAQRNKASRSMTLGLMAISRAPSTGLPAVRMEDSDLIDEASDKKLNENQATLGLIEKSFGFKLKHNDIAYNINEITGMNNWIAVIHADGNGMGTIFQEVGKNSSDMKQISEIVDNITKAAVQKAFAAVRNQFMNDVEKKGKKIPMRPVVLSGDDMTMICRSDIAIAYTNAFLENFEEESKTQLGNLSLNVTANNQLIHKGLTACAGITFVKSSYPFHYAASLAESLCSRAKKTAKRLDETLPPSCMMFHKVQDSFIEDFGEIVKRELSPQNNLTFEYGPYYCGERANQFEYSCGATITGLLTKVSKLSKDKEYKAVKNNLRHWLSMLFDNVEAANQRMKRIRNVSTEAKAFIDEQYENVKNLKDPEEKVDEKDIIKIPYYDILSIASLNIETKPTKKQEDK